MDYYDRATQRPQQRLKLLLSSAQQLKVFKTSLQVLMKVGASNLFIVADENQVSLCACNSSRSCFVSSDLQRSFFSTYEFSCDLPKLKVSIPFKNVQAILRTSRVLVLTFSLVPEINFLIATLECEHSLMKEYRIAFSEDQAIFRPSASTSGRREREASSAVMFDTNDASSFSKVLSTMHVNSAADLVAVEYNSVNDSIRLFTDCHGVQVRPDAEVQKDALHTSLEMNNSIGHFGTIRNTLGMSTKVRTAGGDLEEEEEEEKDARAYSPTYPPTHTHTRQVSFNLKDFLVLVHTAEGLSCDLSLCFSVPGQPIVASCSPGRDCRLEMILVTLNLAGALPSNVMSGGGVNASGASLASQQSLGGYAHNGTNLAAQNSTFNLSQNPFDMLNLGKHGADDADPDEEEEGAGEFGTLGEDADVIASTPPRSPARRSDRAHTPGVIM